MDDDAIYNIIGNHLFIARCGGVTSVRNALIPRQQLLCPW